MAAWAIRRDSRFIAHVWPLYVHAIETIEAPAHVSAYINGRGGISGWQWAYLIIGLIGFVDAALVYFFLPDYPDSPPSTRQFLTQDEGAFLVARLPPSSSRSSDADFDWRAVRRELKTPHLCGWTSSLAQGDLGPADFPGGFALFQLSANSALYGVQFWLPSIIASFNLSKGPKTQLLVIPPAVVYIGASILFAWFIDTDTRVPRPLLAFAGAISLVGFYVGMIVCKSSAGLYVLIIVSRDLLGEVPASG